ncbi:MAG: response regulator transcription factor, partial [Actinomycetota bacterium]|nr:response regulator transcription factor [Actinomycetota bacterium]
MLIVDDHEEFRASARALLEAEGFEVVGEAADGTEAIEAIDALRPAIVLLDVQLPGPDGLTVAEGIAGGPDPPAVVLISSRGAAAYEPRLGQTPARGFIAGGVAGRVVVLARSAVDLASVAAQPEGSLVDDRPRRYVTAQVP